MRSNSILASIVYDKKTASAEKAVVCLRHIAALEWDDAAKPEWAAAAQTFALLAVAEALTSNQDRSPASEPHRGSCRIHYAEHVCTCGAQNQDRSPASERMNLSDELGGF